MSYVVVMRALRGVVTLARFSSRDAADAYVYTIADGRSANVWIREEESGCPAR